MDIRSFFGGKAPPPAKPADDIRSFLGGKAPPPAKPAGATNTPSSATKKESVVAKESSVVTKRKSDVDDSLLQEDSDEDTANQSGRSRLKKVKEVEKEKELKKSIKSDDTPSKRSKGSESEVIVIDDAEEVVEVKLTKEEQLDKILGSPVPKAVVKPANTAGGGLKPLGVSSDDKNDGTKKAVSDPYAFFGGTAPPPAPVKVATPSKSVAAEIDSYNSIKSAQKQNTEKALARKADEMENDGEAADMCLEELKIAVTGAFSKGREAIEEMVTNYGGKLQGAVSGKTDYLVAGSHIEEQVYSYSKGGGSSNAAPANADPRAVETSSKYKAAVEKGVKIINEEEFMNLIKSRSIEIQNGKSFTKQAKPSPKKAKASPAKAPMAPPATVVKQEGKDPSDMSVSELKAAISDKGLSNKTAGFLEKQEFVDLLRSSSSVPSKAATAKPSTTSSSGSSSFFKSTSSSSSAPAFKKEVTAVRDEDLMWVDKYKPKKLEDIMASDGLVKKLQEWLTSWDAVHIKKTKKIAASKENPGAKSVLLSGPPGIGKTTVATLVAKILGYETYELNASDTRSKKAVTEQVADVVMSRAMTMDGGLSKRVVIMDEVDGMGGSDRGGIPELVKVIKGSKTPIICICNDRQAQKIRTLANHCYDLRVKRPIKNIIAKRLVEIGALEGMTVEYNAAEKLVEEGGNDIRQAIHSLQMWHASSNSIKMQDLKEGMKRIEKDKVLRSSPFDATAEILAGKSPFDQRYNMFFIDYSLIPLMVQENYLQYAKGGSLRTASEVDMLTKLSQAADAVSDMELAGSSVMGQDQHWELLPTQAMLSVRVGSIIQGFAGFPSFPSWLGKYSTTGKKKRLTQELVTHTNLKIGQGFTPIRLEYAPYLRNIIVQPLLVKGADAVEETCDLLDAYGLSKDDFSENIRELQFLIEGKLPDHITNIDSKVKAALTRAYNAREHKSQALVDEQEIVKGKKKRSSAMDDEVVGTIEDMDAAQDVEEDEDNEIVDVSKFAAAMRKSKSSSATSKKATTTKATTTKATTTKATAAKKK
jgi:replication factor C subunit 1